MTRPVSNPLPSTDMTTRPSRAIGLAFALACVLPLGLLRAEEDPEPSPAEKLLEVMRYEETSMAAATSMFAPFLDQMRADGTPEAAVKKIEAAARDFVAKSLLDPALRKKVVELYEKRCRRIIEGNQHDSRSLARYMFIENRSLSWARDQMLRHYPPTKMVDQIVDSMRTPF